MEDIDDTLTLLAKAKEIAERIKAREAEQARDRSELERVLRALGHTGSNAFEPGFQVADPSLSISRRTAELHGTVVMRGVAATGTGIFGGTAFPKGSFAMTDLARAVVASGTVRMHAGSATASAMSAERADDEPAKYAVILDLIASNRFDLGMAARAIYNEDSERARNRVRAGVNHLRDRGRVVKNPDGTYSAVRRKPIPGAQASAGKREG